MPNITVLIGLPGCGKSTYADKSNTNVVILSTDNYIENKAKELGKTYSDIFKEYIKEAQKALDQDLKMALEKNLDIIWDQTNLSQRKRLQILAKVPEHYKKIAVEFNLPLEIIYQHLDKRHKETGKFIPKSIVENFYNTREWVDLDFEKFDELITIDSSNDSCHNVTE